MFIYFIQIEDDGPVKIGKTNDVQERMLSLQTAHHKQLKIRFFFEVENEKADYVENHLQYIFVDHKIRGEWFSPSPFMYDFIKKVKEAGFWVNAMDDYEEFLRNDPFATVYNEVYQVIKKARAYGDRRYLKSIATDLEELKRYVFTGRTP